MRQFKIIIANIFFLAIFNNWAIEPMSPFRPVKISKEIKKLSRKETIQEDLLLQAQEAEAISWNKALPIYQHYLHIYPKDFEVRKKIDEHFPQAQILLRQAEKSAEESWEKALPIYRHYLLLCPLDLSTKENFAAHQFESGHHTEAIQCYLELLKLVRHYNVSEFNDYRKVGIYNAIAHSYLELKRPHRALVYFGKVYNIEGDERWLCYNLGRTYLQLKDYQHAINCFNKAEQNGFFYEELLAKARSLIPKSHFHF
ncbi:MAG: tetratricopeptide repeat protein [Verrucomicrobiota bacterium]|nr:tetratricopeptide repeat protein [Verrucomicrobiota bacterium]